RDRQLDIEMYYLVITDSQIHRYLREYHPEGIRQKEDVPELVRQQTDVGTHVRFQYGDRAYLSSCINPNGPSTVDKQQFEANRNTYDLQLARAIPVLLGRESIRDRRCLWTLMSLPAVDEVEAEASFAALEQVWPAWYAWWSDRFPAS
ncbi:MAG: cyanoexosortase A system-associated protein, partial [Cyanobacteria bacterium J06648_11]